MRIFFSNQFMIMALKTLFASLIVNQDKHLIDNDVKLSKYFEEFVRNCRIIAVFLFQIQWKMSFKH